MLQHHMALWPPPTPSTASETPSPLIFMFINIFPDPWLSNFYHTKTIKEWCWSDQGERGKALDGRLDEKKCCGNVVPLEI